MYKLDTPESGVWPFGNDFPDAIEVDGMTFERAIRKQPYSGVVEQYRQTNDKDSAHLMVLENGVWQIDHIDEYNPDMGHPVKHFLIDHPFGKALVYSASGIFSLGLAVIVGKNNARKNSKDSP